MGEKTFILSPSSQNKAGQASPLSSAVPRLEISTVRGKLEHASVRILIAGEGGPGVDLAVGGGLAMFAGAVLRCLCCLVLPSTALPVLSSLSCEGPVYLFVENNTKIWLTRKHAASEFPGQVGARAGYLDTKKYTVL